MPKKIAVFTSFMHQRNGDLISALCFMKAILANDPNTEFEWIVKRDLEGFNRNLQALITSELGVHAERVRLNCLDSADYSNVEINGTQVICRNTHETLTMEEIAHRSENNWGNTKIGWFGWRDVRQKLKEIPFLLRLEECQLLAVTANPHRMIKADYELLHSFCKPIRLVPEYSLEHLCNTTWGGTVNLIEKFC